MSTRTYPRRAVVVQPSGRVQEVEVVASAGYLWDQIASGKTYLVDDLHDTRDAAITAGLERLDEQQAKLTKQQQNLDKKRATLIKARKA